MSYLEIIFKPEHGSKTKPRLDTAPEICEDQFITNHHHQIQYGVIFSSSDRD